MTLHYVKSCKIRSFFWSVFSSIPTEYGKIRTRKNFVFGHFSRSADGHDLIQIGSCGLDVLHGAYGTAQKAADLNSDKLFKAVYSIFKLSPAQRVDCQKVKVARVVNLKLFFTD